MPDFWALLLLYDGDAPRPCRSGIQERASSLTPHRLGSLIYHRLGSLIYHRLGSLIYHRRGSMTHHRLGSMTYHRLGSMTYHRLGSMTYHRLGSMTYLLKRSSFLYLGYLVGLGMTRRSISLPERSKTRIVRRSLSASARMNVSLELTMSGKPTFSSPASLRW